MDIFLNKDIKFNESQKELIKILGILKIRLNDTSLKRKILSFLNKDEALGIYIYGAVGRGKTFIAKTFFDSINLKKRYVHFQVMMQEIHMILHELNPQKEASNNLITKVVKQFKGDLQFLMIDEFEVHNIADAMLLVKILPAFTKMGVFICITSNTPPQYLYNDGLQRNYFEKCISFLIENFLIYNLTGEQDFRKLKAPEESARASRATSEEEILKLVEKYGCILNFADEKNTDIIETYLKLLTDKKELLAHTIIVFEREIRLKHSYNKILITTFEELLLSERSSVDFIEICKYFEVIVIPIINNIASDDRNNFMKLVNFIDHCYAEKILLITLFESDYYLQVTDKITRLERTVSRLSEMNSVKYVKNTKYFSGKFN